MAWPNLDERRKKVKQLLDSDASHRDIRITCSFEFGCSQSAVMADIHSINGNIAHLNSSIRERIRLREWRTKIIAMAKA